MCSLATNFAVAIRHRLPWRFLAQTVSKIDWTVAKPNGSGFRLNWVAILALGMCCGPTLTRTARSHGLPIDVILEDGQLQPFTLNGVPTFDPAVLVTDQETGNISSDSPGLGVTNSANGLPSSTFLGLNVVSELGYFNGSKVLPSAAQLEIIAPSGDASYLLNATSIPQQGMSFGKYDGSRFWEAHGHFNLSPVSAEPGLYGAMVQVTSPAFETSDPFLLPLIYDPVNEFRDATLARGIGLLTQALTTNAGPFDPNDLNADGLVDVFDVNELCGLLSSRSETNPQGIDDDSFARFDVNVDGRLTLSDVQQWLREIDTQAGDTDLNGAVEFADFLTFSSNFGRDDAEPHNNDTVSWSQGDFDCDRRIAFPDFLLLSANFGQAADAKLHTVPEPQLPSDLLLLMIIRLWPRRQRTDREQRQHSDSPLRTTT